MTGAAALPGVAGPFRSPFAGAGACREAGLSLPDGASWPDPVPELAGQFRNSTSLADVEDNCCEAWLAHRRYLLDEAGHVAGERSPATRRAAAQVVADLVAYRELFAMDRVPEGLRRWRGADPSVVAEMPAPGQSKTPPVAGSGLQPMLAAAFYLTGSGGARSQLAGGDREVLAGAGASWLSVALLVAGLGGNCLRRTTS